MRYLFILIAALAVAWSIGNTTGASAEGVSPTTLREDSWDCVDFQALGIHCGHEGWVGSLLTGEATAVTALVFSGDQFLGTELIIRGDLFLAGNEALGDERPPCPTDPDGGQYTDLFPLFGVSYFTCHHYDSPF